MSKPETFELYRGDCAILLNRVEINTGPQEAKALSEEGPRPAIFHIEEGAKCIVIDDDIASTGTGAGRPVRVKFYITPYLTITFYEKRENLKDFVGAEYRHA